MSLNRYAKPSKYRALPTMVDGIKFASKREASRYSILKLQQRAGQIRDLKLQQSYPLVVNGLKVGLYRTDFTYEERSPAGAWSPVVEDSKGFLTPVYRLKKRLVQALYGIQIRET